MNIAALDLHPTLSRSDQLKAAMQRLAGGVVIVTAGTGENRAGFTATSAVSLSVDPPTMLVCANRASSTLPAIRRMGHFCVNILGAEQQAIAERFAGVGGQRGEARYEGLDWIDMPSGAPGLVEAEATVDCVVDEMLERHTHMIILGGVSAVRINRHDGGSLVYRRGRFRALME